MAGEDRISGNIENPRTDRAPDTDGDPIEVPAPPVPASGRFLDESNRLPMRKASRLPDLSAFNKEPRAAAKKNDGGASTANNDGGAPAAKSDGGRGAGKSDGGAPAASRFKPDAVPGWGSPAPKTTAPAQADASAPADQPGPAQPVTEATETPRTGSASTEASTAQVPEQPTAQVTGAARPEQRAAEAGTAPLSESHPADHAAPETRMVATAAASVGSEAPTDDAPRGQQEGAQAASGPNR
ncbi:MAG TPA: hypothetical protein VHH13_09530, partial [Arthrobacter sp.]|nr:hypothetical protein [Arthrobacter sp.]